MRPEKYLVYLIVMCQCWIPSFGKCTILKKDNNHKGNWMGVNRNSVY